MEKKKILYFIKGPLATEKQIEFSKENENKVCFRNVDFYNSDGCLEQCDFVMGEIPFKYKEAEIPIFGVKSIKENENIKEKVELKQITWKPN